MSTLLTATLATLVFCAPGYPGGAGDAQPLIDQFTNAGHDEPARGPQAHVPHGTNIRDRKRAKTDRGREYRSGARQKFVRERTRVVFEESRRIVRLDIP